MEVIIAEYKKLGRLEWWDWYFPHPDYEPTSKGRKHLIGKLYWRYGKE